MSREVDAEGNEKPSSAEYYIWGHPELRKIMSQNEMEKINTVFISLHIDLPQFICQRFYNNILYECAIII